MLRVFYIQHQVHHWYQCFIYNIKYATGIGIVDSTHTCFAYNIKYTTGIVDSVSCRSDVVTALLAAGADPNARDNRDQTPLHIRLKRAEVYEKIVLHSPYLAVNHLVRDSIARNADAITALLAAGAH